MPESEKEKTMIMIGKSKTSLKQLLLAQGDMDGIEHEQGNRMLTMMIGKVRIVRVAVLKTKARLRNQGRTAQRQPLKAKTAPDHLPSNLSVNPLTNLDHRTLLASLLFVFG